MEPGTPEINPTQPETKPKKPAIAGKLIKALGVGIVGGTMVIADRGAEAKHSPDVGKLPESPVTLVAGSEVSEAASPLETVFAVNDGPKFLDTAALNAAHAENPEDPAIIAIDKALFECAQNQDFGDPSHPIQPSKRIS